MACYGKHLKVFKERSHNLETLQYDVQNSFRIKECNVQNKKINGWCEKNNEEDSLTNREEG